jgi:hypothetical protein
MRDDSKVRLTPQPCFVERCKSKIHDEQVEENDVQEA